MINKKKFALVQPLSRDEENAAIAKDLRKVLWLNLSYLVLVLVIFFTDQRFHYLTKIFGGLWK
jgi:hypothetical protein